MFNFETALEKEQYTQILSVLVEELKSLSSKVNPKDELWDDQDMIQNWKVSKRLLADWRKEHVIDYVQYKNKIWYPRDARTKFIAKYKVKSSGDKINPAITN